MSAELRRRVRELAEEWDFVPRADCWAGPADPEFSRELGRRGLLAVNWPKEVGGGGGSYTDRLAVTEELLRAGAPVSGHWIGERQIGPSLIAHGTPELQQEFCPRLARAEITFALGMSEPDAGSDLASVRTFAAREEDGSWLVNGRKVWTSGAHRASHLYLLARTSRQEDRHEGITEFILDMDSPGVTVHPIPDFAGEHHFNEVVLENVRVPADRVLGRVGEGWSQVVGQLSYERGGPERFLSMYPLLAAIVRAGLPDAQARRELRDLTGRLTALRALARSNAEQMDAGRGPVHQAAVSKYLGNRFELDVVEWARPMMARADASVRELFRQCVVAAPASGIRGGAAQILLSVIAKGERR
jgi:alkylation response protein AidB-like acyl-CoA dehydrogenase